MAGIRKSRGSGGGMDVAARKKKKLAVAVEGKEKKLDSRLCFLKFWEIWRENTFQSEVVCLLAF